MPMQIRGTSTVDDPPSGLAERQLSVEMAGPTPKLWVGVPTSIDAAGRRLIAPVESQVPLGGQFRLLSGNINTQVVFAPFISKWTRIAGKLYELPDAGVLSNVDSCVIDGVSGSVLPNLTLYRAYLFDDAGVLRIEFSETGHVASTISANIGTEIKQGDDSRTFIGLLARHSDGWVYNTPARANIRSWYNKTVTGIYINTAFPYPPSDADVVMMLTTGDISFVNFHRGAISISSYVAATTSASSTVFRFGNAFPPNQWLASMNVTLSVNIATPITLAYSESANEGFYRVFNAALVTQGPGTIDMQATNISAVIG